MGGSLKTYARKLSNKIRNGELKTLASVEESICELKNVNFENVEDSKHDYKKVFTDLLNQHKAAADDY